MLYYWRKQGMYIFFVCTTEEHTVYAPKRANVGHIDILHEPLTAVSANRLARDQTGGIHSNANRTTPIMNRNIYQRRTDISRPLWRSVLHVTHAAPTIAKQYNLHPLWQVCDTSRSSSISSSGDSSRSHRATRAQPSGERPTVEPV